jgi:hypothetical protein
MEFDCFYLHIERKTAFQLYLGLEEVLGAADADLVDVDLGEGGQLTQAGLQLQLTRPRLPEYRQKLPTGRHGGSLG